MFENYGKKTETDSIYQRIGLMTLLIAFVGLPTMIYLNSRSESPNPQLNHTVSLSDEEAEQRVKKLCESLPKPEKFELTVKGTASDTPNSTVVYYQYESPRSLEELMPVFTLWFNENGWQRDASADSTYLKGSQKVYISTATYNDYDFTIYNIYCSEKK